MRFIKLEDSKSDEEAILAYINEAELRTDFDTGKTKVTIMYFKGGQDKGDKIAQVLATLGDNYISDTYNLTGTVTKEQKIQAALDAGRRIFEEKGVPVKYFSAIFLSQHPVIYTELPDAKAV